MTIIQVVNIVANMKIKVNYKKTIQKRIILYRIIKILKIKDT